MVIITKKNSFTNVWDFNGPPSEKSLTEFIVFAQGDTIVKTQEVFDLKEFNDNNKVEFYEWCSVCKEDSFDEEFGWHTFIPSSFY